MVTEDFKPLIRYFGLGTKNVSLISSDEVETTSSIIEDSIACMSLVRCGEAFKLLKPFFVKSVYK